MSISNKITDYIIRHSNIIRKLAMQETGGNESKLLGDNTDIGMRSMRNVYGLYMTELANLKSDQIKLYIDAARRGLGYFKTVVFEEIKRKDMQIGGVCQTRKLSLTGKHRMNEIDDFIECEDEELRQFVVDILQEINCAAFASDVIDASLSGVSCFEINYRPLMGGKWGLASVDKIPNELLVYDTDNNQYKFLAESSRDVFLLRNVMSIISQVDKIDLSKLNLIDLPPAKLLEVHSLDGNCYNGIMNGCSDSLIWAYLFKNYVIKDLATFIELFAIPAIIGKYDPFMSTEDRMKFEDAIINFGNYMRMVVSKDADVQFITDTNKGSSSDIFHKSLEYWDEKIAIRVLGQSLTTQMSSKGGSYAASKTHDAVREDIVRSDMGLVENAFDELIRKIVDMNYSSVKKYPVFRLPESLDADGKKILSEVYMNIKGMGYQVSKEQIENEFETGELEELPATTQLPAPQGEGNQGKEFRQKLIDLVGKLSNSADKNTIIENDIDEFLEMLWESN